ncbi:hypothetical protein [Streptomyces cyaneofuscatus]|uniref:hypothetical protein n=1 Tax=Streptomyces cyaneofuscatus TaxID=66883 RepID=UPI0034390A1C
MTYIDRTITTLLALTAAIASLGGCVALLLSLKELVAAHGSASAALCAMATASFSASAALAGLRHRYHRRSSTTTQD